MLIVDNMGARDTRGTMAMKAKPLGARRKTLAVEARREIERMIVDGELGAGERLNEIVLSEAMGVSRGTVREAIRSLADSGLIELIANRGAFVREATFSDIRNLYDLRGAVFAMACKSAARRVRDGLEPGLADRLGRNLDEMRTTLAENDIRKYYRLNIEFHDMLLQGAGNAKAQTVYDALIREMHLFRRRGLSVAANIALSIEEHEAIRSAVVAGDAEGARAAADTHIVAGFERYCRMLDSGAEVAV